MGVRNYLIEGVSGTGKTAVAEELHRRGHHVVHGDRELARTGDPQTGRPLDPPPMGDRAQSAVWAHEHHVWDEDKLRALVADRTHAVTFFCGGARNFPRYIALFDEVFVLDVDGATLRRRLAARPADEFGGDPAEQALIARLHATQEDIPHVGITIDATAPLAGVVDQILAHVED